MSGLSKTLAAVSCALGLCSPADAQPTQVPLTPIQAPFNPGDFGAVPFVQPSGQPGRAGPAGGNDPRGTDAARAAAFARLLKDERPAVREQAARALRRLGVEARPQLADVEKLKQDPDPDVRKVAAEAVEWINAEVDRESLLKDLWDKTRSPSSRRAVCQDLARRFPDHPATAPNLEGALLDPEVAEAAALALREVGQRRVTQPKTSGAK